MGPSMQVDIYMGTERSLVGVNGGEEPCGVFFIPRFPSEMLPFAYSP